MRITEMFESIQGEGPLAGTRAVFIRTHGCNLSCAWCDTKYAWEDSNYLELTVGQILDYVMRVPGIKHVVITGGEPTIQMGELEELATKLRELGRHITLETNGVIKPNIDLFDLVMVSPKSIATAEEWFVEAISRKNVEYKFVIGPKEIELVLDWIRSKGLIGVYLMPMGADIDSVINGSQVIMAAMIDKHLDCIICPRIHVLMGVK